MKIENLLSVSRYTVRFILLACCLALVISIAKPAYAEKKIVESQGVFFATTSTSDLEIVKLAALQDAKAKALAKLDTVVLEIHATGKQDVVSYKEMQVLANDVIILLSQNLSKNNLPNGLVEVKVDATYSFDTDEMKTLFFVMNRSASYADIISKHELVQQEYAAMLENNKELQSLKDKEAYMRNAANQLAMISLWQKGNNAYVNRDYDAALSYYKEAKKIEPNNAGNYYLTGITYYMLKQTKKAESEFLKSIKLKPSGVVYNDLGVIVGREADRYARLGNQKLADEKNVQAIAYLKKSMEFPASHTVTIYNTMHRYKAMKKYNEALIYANLLVDAKPRYLLARSFIHKAMGNEELANEDIKKYREWNKD